jgi:hypothetical protein
MNLTINPATSFDAYLMNLREEDLQEVLMSSSGKPPHEVVEESIRISTAAWAADDGDRVVAVWGIAESPLGVHPWLLCSEAVKGHPRAVARISRRFVGALRAHHPRPICNLVSKAAQGNRAFIRSLGFVIVDRPGNPFDYFYLPQPCATPFQLPMSA